MMKHATLLLIGTGLVVAAAAQQVPLLNLRKYIFMTVHVKNEKGETDNQKFFLGPLPAAGEAVEMVFIGNEPDGGMAFQLRTKIP